MTARPCTFVVVHTPRPAAMGRNAHVESLLMLLSGISKSVSLFKERFTIEW